MTANVTQIKPDAPVQLPHFVETPSSRTMLVALRRARARSRLTMIIGGSGVGKSRTKWSFRQEAPDAYIIEARAQEGGAWNLAYRLCELLGMPEPNSRNMPRTGHEISEAIGPGGFVIIDEAQYLVQENARGPDNWGAVEWFRGVAEEGYFGAAFIGDRRLANSLKDAAQLRRRTHPRVYVDKTTEDDVATFCRAFGLTDPKALRILSKCARVHGGLGDVSETLTTAMDMNGGALPSVEDIHAALQFCELDQGNR